MAPTAPQNKALVVQPVGKRPRGRPQNGWDKVQGDGDLDDTSKQLGE